MGVCAVKQEWCVRRGFDSFLLEGQTLRCLAGKDAKRRNLPTTEADVEVHLVWRECEQKERKRKGR